MRRAFFPIVAVSLLCLVAISFAACGGSSHATAAPPPRQTPFELNTDTSTDVFPVAVVNSPYSYAIQSNAGEPNVTATLPVTFSAKGMPPGMAMSANGAISGTPTKAGVYAVVVSAVDSAATPHTTGGGYTMNVRLPGATLTQVAHNNLGGAGQNAYVTVATASVTHTPYAYVGTRGALGDCPATGVKIVDLIQITSPQLVAEAGGVDGASQERARIASGITSPGFHSGSHGDLMAVTEQPCNPAIASSNQEGVEFFDVTDPAHPLLLGTWQSGVQGVSDVQLLPENGSIYALAAVPNSENAQTANPEGDLRVLDVTDPTAPREIGNWGLMKATGIPAGLMYMGQDQRVFLDSISISNDLKTAYLSYWDGGVVLLDVSQPTVINPNNAGIFVNHLTYPTTAAATTTTPSAPEGNTHETLPVDNGAEMLIVDRVCASGTPLNPALAVVCGPQNSTALSPSNGWGYLRTYALPTPNSFSLGGFFITGQSTSAPAPDNGIYTANDLAWNGNLDHPHAYVGWMSSGLVDLDISSIAAPQMLATFVPADTADPNGITAQDNPKKAMVYGVASYVSNGQPYILASDINSGLWILEETPTGTLAILTTSLPDGNVGLAYNAKLSAINGAVGKSSVTFKLAPGSNPLPGGITLIDSQGDLSGVPVSTGTTTVTFEADDGMGHSTQQAMTITVKQTLAIRSTQQPPQYAVGEPMSLTLTGLNGVAPYTWSVLSPLPEGVNISPASGVISGTPASTGITTTTVQVTDSSTPPFTASLPITFKVTPLAVSSADLPTASVGASYSDTVTMANGTGPYQAVLISGTLPPGVALSPGASPNSGWLISGTPTTAGSYNFSVLVTDADGQSTTQPFTLVVNPFEVNPAVLPYAREDHGYNEQLNVQGGVSPYSFNLVTGSLPAGLSLSLDGSLAGVPTSGTAGIYELGLLIKDSNGVTANQTLELDVFSGNSFQVTTTGFPPAVVGQQFQQSITADFGVPPYSFQLLNGILPSGIAFGADGTLAGVPAAASTGSYAFTVQATGNDNQTTSRHFVLTVLAPASPQ
ncbi:MAG TPA: putative Ig domain-containing protein [Terriglobales bacterium]|jgi:hypothetical protein